MTAKSAYQDLQDRFQRMAVFSEAMSVLHWDMAVMMPPGGAEPRSEQLAALKVMHHKMLTDPAVRDLLDASENMALDDWQRANLNEMRRAYIHAVAVPEDLVAASSKSGMECETLWRRAKKQNDFDLVAPALTKLLGLTRQVAQAKAEKLGCTDYDALLDEYEPGGKSANIQPIFDDYAAFLPDFLDQVLSHQEAKSPLPPLKGPFPIETQKRMTRQFAETVGFSFTRGRLDESAHPFSTGYKGDSRITTIYSEDDFSGSLMAVLHECGHALYEQGLPDAWTHQPVGDARGMTIHESQSLIIEMQACRSREFASFAAPILREAFGHQEGLSDENYYRRNILVKPDFIRVDADEVTYPAHVILRFRLEQAMLKGDLTVAELPGAWNEGMTSLLGITPPTDTLGCMQDIHWYDGAWGYFPTYTLGAMTSAQLFQAATEADAAILPAIGKGDFSPLLSWLRTHVHGQGSLLSTDELVSRATGRPLDPEAFKNHLKRRYLSD
ncbi:carboxypeptidase M32 [Aestuariispira insulae]|uniref:Metal-dependent carboxypeptidase n=1 Tax=Aestuariispira insulae TaxID=1461337 RepID=A0A3D9HGM8_9PROT|nr:carboxypeptidase M32 [Aestuariispira insulae]RED48637.1 carboxypeptidase Taq [Aestuariispira insulae]